MTLQEIEGGVKLLTAIARVNGALETNNPEEVWKHLIDPLAHIDVIYL